MNQRLIHVILERQVGNFNFTCCRGAGKTTLLNVLAHRKIEQLEVTGTVYVREEPVGINIRDVSAYVEDNDVFVGSLTVREHLVFQV